MSGRDVPIDEMRISLVSERDVERLFAGRIPAGGPELDDLTTFFVRLSDAYPKPSVAPYEEAHLAAMRQASQVVTGEADAVAERSTAAPKPLARRFIARGLVRVRTRTAAGGMAMVVALSALAGAGVLPAPMQQAVARAAAKVGIRLPGAPEVPGGGGAKDLKDAAGHDGAQHRDGWMSGWTGWTRHEAGPAGEKDGFGDDGVRGGGSGAGGDRSEQESESDQESDDEDDLDDDFEDEDDFDDPDDSDDSDSDDESDDDDGSEHEQGSEDDEESESDDLDEDPRDASEQESDPDTETEESD